ncbi:hypothetical protein QP185_19090 [Sphingomonas aerolata]
MAVKFAGTMNAINRGLDATKPAKGADMVEGLGSRTRRYRDTRRQGHSS